ncbi:hypothetical protein CCP3SC15_990018 [Gammaproteobacteria bacterium]
MIEHAAQFTMGEERGKLMFLAQVQTEMAQAFFTLAHRNADYSEPDVRLSNETWRAFEAERERAAKFTPAYKPEARPRSDQGGTHSYPKGAIAKGMPQGNAALNVGVGQWE